tara:strand:+ start:848 stop:985 length:138 start_codon:yes stop_codon:yes gene_type:complete
MSSETVEDVCEEDEEESPRQNDPPRVLECLGEDGGVETNGDFVSF